MEVTQKKRQVLELLKLTENLFKERLIDNPRLNAELLLAHTLNTERIKLYLDFEKPVTDEELAEFKDKVKRRLNHEPVQYIVGEAHFFGRKFKVNKSVLIPRPETELIVEKTLETCAKNSLESPKILEIGTGSGCISISIAGAMECFIDAIELSAEAIEIAKENAEVNNTDKKINFKKNDIINQDIKLDDYDIVISNPPYISKNDFSDLAPEIKNHEPVSALTDGEDGLRFYRRIFELYNLAEKKPYVLLEIGDGKKDIVENLLKDSGIGNYFFHKDLLNINRVLEFFPKGWI